MRKIKHNEGFLGFRTSKETEHAIKTLCGVSNKEISEVLNYLCRIFIKDEHGIRSRFLRDQSSELDLC